MDTRQYLAIDLLGHRAPDAEELAIRQTEVEARRLHRRARRARLGLHR